MNRAIVRYASGIIPGVLLLMTLLVLTPTVSADVLHLRHGKRVEGRVRVLTNGDYSVTVEPGRHFTIAAEDVTLHEKRKAPIDELAERLPRIRPGDRDALVDLAAWAEQKGLRTSALDVYRKILRIDPHHVGARNRLGYVLYKNRWYPRKELEGKGLVRFRGLWMTPDDVDGIRQKEAAEEFRALLEDIKSPNRYLRENGLARVSELRSPHVRPALIRALQADDPVDRVIAMQALEQHGFEVAGQKIYDALLRERRPEVRTGYIAVLHRFGQGVVGRWAARDLAKRVRAAERDDPVLRNLLALLENCPHRAAVPSLIDLVDRPGWGPVADGVLSRTLRTGSRDGPAWAAWWSAHGSGLGEDLGSGWITRSGKRL